MDDQQNGNDVFDLDIFDTKTKANEGIELKIYKPDGEFSGLYIRVLGSDSDQYQKLKRKQEKQRVKVLSRGGRDAVENLYEVDDINAIDLVVAATLGWRHENGKPMPFDIGADRKSAKAFYQQYPVAYNQVKYGISNPENFMKVSAEPSSDTQMPLSS